MDGQERKPPLLFGMPSLPLQRHSHHLDSTETNANIRDKDDGCVTDTHLTSVHALWKFTRLCEQKYERPLQAANSTAS